LAVLFRTVWRNDDHGSSPWGVGCPESYPSMMSGVCQASACLPAV
jgi:hypothetical protein